MGVQKGNLDLIRDLNRRLVLDAIIRDQPISRADLARKLSLSRSTVSMIVNDLQEKEMVIELGMGDSTANGGRKGQMLGFNPRSAFLLGMDLQKNRINSVLADLSGTVEQKETIPFNEDLDELKTILSRYLERIEPDYRVLGIGVSVPSIVKDHQIVVDAPSLGWYNVNLAKVLSEAFDLDVFVMNDVNAAAFGERWIGQSSLVDDLFYLSVGTGVGSAIISGGDLVAGFEQAAGEIGYMLTEEDIKQGTVYEKGRFGTFERKITSLLHTCESSKEARNRLVHLMALMMSNVCILLNPEKVIIGGYYETILKAMIPEIQGLVQRLVPISTVIEYGALGEDASAMGTIKGLLDSMKDQMIRKI
ncbi:ROK family transcriptional regulator [Sporolactobacillus kofuensis]|uniref:ROK family transcriptional regulator n=1 Tax=Sporolactobacillus kofuensis TaxID=269672 RepID=A0ABW1WF57_9BACL|nr:ROK family transcriptional regulator [Sporolactobacillus kofuensis]MCO7174813.1 ROK family transcriptional regulator [Sporolactobacillus kofuensis]